jgi:hypothetical protein
MLNTARLAHGVGAAKALEVVEKQMTAIQKSEAETLARKIFDSQQYR